MNLKKIGPALTAVLLFSNFVYAKPVVPDTPNVAYGTARTLIIGTPVTITPTSTNVGPAIFSTPVTLPFGITAPKVGGVDNNLNFYILDTVKEKVFKIAAGTTTPVAYSAGFVKGTTMAVDYDGNVFIADASNDQIIQKPYNGGKPISIFTNPVPILGMAAVGANSNIIYFVDGGPNIGTLNWPNSIEGGISAGLTSPTAIAVDGSGKNVYVTDPGSNGVYKISTISPYTKTLLYTDTNYPNSIAVDYNGNVFVTEAKTNNVVMIPSAGTPLVAGSGFNKPTSVFINNFFSYSPNVYLCDSGNGAVKQFTRTGGYYAAALPAGLKINITTGVISGTPTTVTPATDYLIMAYNGVSTSTSKLNLRTSTGPLPAISYQSPQTYTRGVPITPLSPTTSGVASFGFSAPFAKSNSYINGVYVYDASGNEYVLYNNTITEYPANGSSLKVLATNVTPGTTIAIDSAKNIYVASYANNVGSVLKYPAGSNTPVTVSSAFKNPAYICADGPGNIYVLDLGTYLVQKIPVGSSTPITIASDLVMPSGMVIDGQGNLFVADAGTHGGRDGGAIQGKGIFKLNTTAPYAQTVLYAKSTYEPYSIAIDGGGNVYFTDPSKYKLLKMIPCGAKSAITLSSGTRYNGVKTDFAGNLYLSDGTNISQEIYPVGGYFSGITLPQGLTVDVTTGVISGTPVAVSAAKKYSVIAYNVSGCTTAKITISVKAANPANDSLAMLNVSKGTLTPAFASGTFSYKDTVSADTVNLTPVAGNPAATIRVNGTVLPGGSAAKLGLALGNNTVTVRVTSPDSSASLTYTVVINRFIASVNDNLSGLAVNKGTLTPAFSSNITAYADTVLATTANLIVTPTAADPTAVIKVNGTVVPSGAASASLPLSVGVNTVTVLVAAQSGAQKSYTLTVTRPISADASLSSIVLNDNAVLSPVFNADSLIYATALAYSYTSVTVKPRATNAGATIKVNGVAVASNTTSAPIALPVGTTGIRIVVTAADGTTTRNYIVRVTRNRSANDLLSNLTLSAGTALSPAFADTVYTYNSSVANSVTSIMFRPVAADSTETIRVNGVTVASGNYSQAVGLSVGSKTVKIVVVSQSGATTTYSVTVTRAAANTLALNNTEDGVYVHPAISPNGDGVNDVLTIDRIAEHPDNTLSIINAAGGLVYKVNGYDNVNKVFNGHASGSNNLLPKGTYFYILTYGGRSKSGYVVLKY